MDNRIKNGMITAWGDRQGGLISARSILLRQGEYTSDLFEMSSTKPTRTWRVFIQYRLYKKSGKDLGLQSRSLFVWDLQGSINVADGILFDKTGCVGGFMQSG